MRILYKFPTRERPYRFFKCLDNIKKFAQHNDYIIEVTADIDDATMFNPEVIEQIKQYDKVNIRFGTSKNKVDAIKADGSIKITSAKDEAISALATLGYQRQLAEKVVRDLLSENANYSLEELIRKSLAGLNK